MFPRSRLAPQRLQRVDSGPICLEENVIEVSSLECPLSANSGHIGIAEFSRRDTVALSDLMSGYIALQIDSLLAI